jgi:hypothetical protein
MRNHCGLSTYICFVVSVAEPKFGTGAFIIVSQVHLEHFVTIYRLSLSEKESLHLQEQSLQVSG